VEWWTKRLVRTGPAEWRPSRTPPTRREKPSASATTADAILSKPNSNSLRNGLRSQRAPLPSDRPFLRLVRRRLVVACLDSWWCAGAVRDKYYIRQKRCRCRSGEWRRDAVLRGIDNGIIIYLAVCIENGVSGANGVKWHGD